MARGPRPHPADQVAKGASAEPRDPRRSAPPIKAANDVGTFKSDDELRQIYGDAGLDDGKDTIALCRIGKRSSHKWFVLKELLGHENVKNYDGSWTEYGSLVGVPVALGDEPGEA
ncbi:hypothetical protein GCM10023226_07280 [Nocardioides nanhaiensis]|uniref:thiosulfate sulfurtransferase n=1 Tax=Nocardioides nanhaiensis TaxID=1476871 RepID=A0ABP8VUB9_9ACTN